jgi:hypothetical protein
MKNETWDLMESMDDDALERDIALLKDRLNNFWRQTLGAGVHEQARLFELYEQLPRNIQVVNDPEDSFLLIEEQEGGESLFLTV